MSNDTQITLTPDFLRKIGGLLEDYNSGYEEYAIDRIVGEYEAEYGVQVSNADMLEALQAESLI